MKVECISLPSNMDFHQSISGGHMHSASDAPTERQLPAWLRDGSPIMLINIPGKAISIPTLGIDMGTMVFTNVASHG